MKKLLLLVFLASGLTTYQTFGQTFSVSYDTITNFTASKVEVHNTITNTSANDLWINWKIVTGSPDTRIETGWIVEGICDNFLCYTYNDLSGGATKTSDTIHAGGNMDFKVLYDATTAAISTLSWVTIKFTDLNNSSNTKNATFIAYKTPTGVTNITKSEDNVTLFPNPARSNVNVIFDGSLGVKNIAIYNLIGKAVSVYKVSGTSAKLDLESIPSGIYFVRLINGQGQIVATRKFTHQ